MGLGFLMQTAYLMPLTLISLVVAVAGLGFRAKRRRGYGPLILGLVSGVALVVGKFVVDSNIVIYGSIAALVGASLWNAWPNRRAAGIPDAPAGKLYQIGIGSKKEEVS
jgi:hypothetical protein